MKNFLVLGCIGTFLLILIYIVGDSLFSSQSIIGKDQIAVFGNKNRYSFVQTVEGNRIRLLDFKMYHAILEGDVWYFHESGDFLFVYGYNGFTVINIKTNDIRQYRMTWGPSGIGGNSSTEPFDLKGQYRNNYKLLDSFEQFSDEEKEEFRKYLDGQRKDLQAYHEKILISDQIKIVNVFPSKEIRLLEASRGSVIEPNVIGYKKEGNRIYFYGDYSFSIVQVESYEIIQYQFAPYQHSATSDPSISKLKSKYGNLYKKVEKFEDFAKEEQEIFLELKENPEKYRPKF